MLLTLLLTNLVLPTWAQYILSFLPALGLGVGWLMTWRKNKKEEDKEALDKLEKEKALATALEATKQADIQFRAKVEERFTGVNLAMERMGDEFKAKCAILDREVAQIPALRDLLGRLETKLEMNGKTQDRMENKLDRFLENFPHKS